MPKLTRYDIRKLLYETLLLTEMNSAANTGDESFDVAKYNRIIPIDATGALTGSLVTDPNPFKYLAEKDNVFYITNITSGSGGDYTATGYVHYPITNSIDTALTIDEETFNALKALTTTKTTTAAKNWAEYIKVTKGGDKIKQLWEKEWKSAGGKDESYKGYTSWYKTIKKQNGDKHLSPEEIIEKLKSNDGKTLLAKIATGVANVSQAVADNSTDRQARRKERLGKIFGKRK